MEPNHYDAVVAASSFHWVTPEIGYPKAAAALRPEGRLILLWNKELQPSEAIFQQLSPVYAQYAPALPRQYENLTTQVAILDRMGQMAIESGSFKTILFDWIEVPVTYSIEQYLVLLTTYSPYLKLEPSQQQDLLQGLRQVLQAQGDRIPLTYVSAFHVAHPY